MTHDPLCPNAAGSCCLWMVGGCTCQCECDQIAKVRADERAACIAAVNEHTYEKVLKATASPKTARAQVYTLHALARASMLEVQP